MLSETLKAADLHLNPFLLVSVRLFLFLNGVCVQGCAGAGLCQEPAMGGGTHPCVAYGADME